MSDDSITNFPLAWPVGRPRTKNRSRALFRRGTRALSVADGCERVLGELSRLGVHSVIISSNIRPTLVGVPRSGATEPGDPGAAVYFNRKGRPYCLACDRWDRVADNLAAIAAEIEANRGRERWGVVTLEEAFEGFVALPSKKPWWAVLGLPSAEVTLETLRSTFRTLAHVHHPDRGGNTARMAEVSAAYEEGLEVLQKGRGAA